MATSYHPPAFDSSAAPTRAEAAAVACAGPAGNRARWHLVTIVCLWTAVFAASLARPPLLDDADATHAQAAQAMLATGDYVTLHVDGIRYLEKPPLPYWLAALSLRLLGAHPAYAIHLPLALTVLALALLGYMWSRRAFGQQAALYAAIFLLTAAGVFLFTRVFIPDAMLSLWLALALYAMVQALHRSRRWAYLFWGSMALAVLTKGLVAIAFLLCTALAFGAVTGTLRQWRRLSPIGGGLLFLAIAAPWHVLASLRNTGGADGHGFLWFYFVNEHLLRFLGRRIPRDYNKLPAIWYWSLHLVWLFPWSAFLPLGAVMLWRRRSVWTQRRSMGFREQTVVLLLLFSALVVVFFSLSTNQEYYTFPVYLPLLMLLAAAAGAAQSREERWWLSFGFGAATLAGLGIAAALGYGLWSARALPFVPDIGAVLAHRGVGGYTLSMSHFFDLTGRSFAALRLPAALAAAALAIGPGAAWWLEQRGRRQQAVLTLAATAAVFLIAAHLALERFAPMLSSEDFAATILQFEYEHRIAPQTTVMIYGDQALGSSLPFYLRRRVLLVDGRSTSMLFGSTFADAPPIFVTHEELAATWGSGARKVLFVPPERREEVDRLLAGREIVVAETSGKVLLTDRPIDSSIDSMKGADPSR